MIPPPAPWAFKPDMLDFSEYPAVFRLAGQGGDGNCCDEDYADKTRTVQEQMKKTPLSLVVDIMDIKV